MGTYTDLSIAGYPIITTRSAVDPVVMTIFRETDKRIFKRRISDKIEVTWNTESNEEEGEIETICMYSSTVQNIKQRLEIMGFSLGKTQIDFDAGITRKIRELEEELDDYEWEEDNPELVSEKSLIETSGFDDWLNAFRYILSRKLPIDYWHRPSESYPALVRFMLWGEEYEYEPLYRFPCSDERYLLRMFLEVSEPQSPVIQDISALIYSGYYDFSDEVCALSIQALTADYPLNSKIVILTEGSTDRFALEMSLKLLYPHLYDYYSFMDFNTSNSAGGASSLAAAVKAFVGSGITNRIIAIFDNDTAASVAKKGLSRTQIPDNIKVTSYPDIDIARDYPAIGPAGISRVDINGLACSIELYFGTDVLTQDQQLTLVQWKGYDESIQQYQGEVLNKKALQDAFSRKVERCIADPSAVSTTDWGAMRAIWQHIFQCFS